MPDLKRSDSPGRAVLRGVLRGPDVETTTVPRRDTGGQRNPAQETTSSAAGLPAVRPSGRDCAGIRRHRRRDGVRRADSHWSFWDWAQRPARPCGRRAIIGWTPGASRSAAPAPLPSNREGMARAISSRGPPVPRAASDHCSPRPGMIWWTRDADPVRMTTPSRRYLCTR
jgi:hypothetical protein